MLTLLGSRRLARSVGVFFVLGADNPILGSSPGMTGQEVCDRRGSIPRAVIASSAARSPSIQAPWAVP